MNEEYFAGLNIGLHDSGVCLLKIVNSRLSDIQIYSEERFNRRKHAGSFPFVALERLINDHPDIRCTLPANNVALNCTSARPQYREESYEKVAPGYKERILERKISQFSSLTNPTAQFITHHLAHAYSAWATSPFRDCLVVVADGIGNGYWDFDDSHPEKQINPPGTNAWHAETLSTYRIENGELRCVDKVWSRFDRITGSPFFSSNSLGNIFAATAQLLFRSPFEAGKVMGLAAYGKANHEFETAEELMAYIASKRLPQLSGKRAYDSLSATDFSERANIAAEVQATFEKLLRGYLTELSRKFPQTQNLILVGGCALNCTFNGKLSTEKIFRSLFIPSFPNDEGIAFGAAVALAVAKGKVTFRERQIDQLTAFYSAQSNDTQRIREDVQKTFPTYELIPISKDAKKIASLLSKNEVIAWVHGRAEVGPRALGARSILMHPGRPNGKVLLNNQVKHRENFRPYGGVFLQPDITDYFSVNEDFHSPFMNVSLPVNPDKRALLESIVHVDGTCRLQTLTRTQQPFLYQVMEEFKKMTGLSCLLNTSLNVMGQPILENAAQAQEFLDYCPEIKYLVYGDFLIARA